MFESNSTTRISSARSGVGVRPLTLIFLNSFLAEDEYRFRRTSSTRERQHRGRYESFSPETASHRWRPASPEYGRRVQRSWTPTLSRSLPQRKSTNEEPGAEMTEWTGSTAAQDGDLVGTHTPLDRSERRRKQASRESEKAKRERDGKKAFYLTLDPQGKPFGLGKPTWVAEINKLAIGLDPSCTHIRKQTYEDVQTLKDRLSENFEYSGKLNEDHLRGLMGKAVTKRRGELISLIRRNGDQPKHVNMDVWIRLQQLADSRQHQEKSE